MKCHISKMVLYLHRESLKMHRRSQQWKRG